MYFVVEYVKLSRVVSMSAPTRNYDTALIAFDRIKKSGVREARMVKVERGVRKILKFVTRTRDRSVTPIPRPAVVFR